MYKIGPEPLIYIKSMGLHNDYYNHSRYNTSWEPTMKISKVYLRSQRKLETVSWQWKVFVVFLVCGIQTKKTTQYIRLSIT